SATFSITSRKSWSGSHSHSCAITWRSSHVFASLASRSSGDKSSAVISALVLTENLVSDYFGIDEWKALAKAARSTRRLRLKFSTRTLRCLPSYRFEDNRTHAFEESTVETY